MTFGMGLIIPFLRPKKPGGRKIIFSPIFLEMERKTMYNAAATRELPQLDCY
jgi:hypothetical protein